MNRKKVISMVPFVSYLDDVELSDGLLSGAISCALVVACSDMGKLSYLCADPSANLLIFQNCSLMVSTTAIAALLAESGISDLIVYGHDDCQFTRALAKPQNGPGEMQALIEQYFRLESESIARFYSCELTANDASNWRRINEWNVLRQMKAILVNPGVLRRVEQGRLRLHAWLLSAQSRLTVFSPERNRFVEVVSNGFTKGLRAYSSHPRDDC